MRPSKRIQAVLYDFDGTLADTTELIMDCYRHTMAVHLGAAPPDEEWLAGFGTPLEAQIRRFARSRAEYEAMLETYCSYQERRYAALLRPFPGACATVAALVERGVPLAIVTSRYRESTVRGMELCGLGSHFREIVTPEDVRNAKPHPEPVLKALERLGIAPEEALFVGDSPHDLAAGRAAGTLTAAALWGPFSRSVLEAECPDFLLESQEDVLEILDGVRGPAPQTPT